MGQEIQGLRLEQDNSVHESIFQTSSNRLRHWGKIRKFCYRKRYVPQQMIWGAISARGTVGIYFLEEVETVTANLYVEKILEGVLHPNAHALFGEDFTFQQDNATPHRAAVVRGQ